jgi:hypothetical protein
MEVHKYRMNFSEIKDLWGDQIKEHAWDKREMHIKFWLENLKGLDHSENWGVGWRIILDWLFREITQVGDLWWVAVNVIKNIPVP